MILNILYLIFFAIPLCAMDGDPSSSPPPHYPPSYQHSLPGQPQIVRQPFTGNCTLVRITTALLGTFGPLGLLAQALGPRTDYATLKTICEITGYTAHIVLCSLVFFAYWGNRIGRL